MNTLYDHEHCLTQEDVDAANALVRHIERTRNLLVPQVGDRVRYTTRYGDFYGNALIEAVREGGTLSICICPYVPFVWRTADGIGCAVSGGPFTAVTSRALQPRGSVQGDFCDWGHCGACGNGAVRFCAEVPPDLFCERRPAQGIHQLQHIFSCCIFGRPEKAVCRCIHCQSDSGNGQIQFPVLSHKICNIAYIPFPEQVLCMTGNEGTSMLPFPLRLAAE